jgi:pilus assembly protein FimV
MTIFVDPISNKRTRALRTFAKLLIVSILFVPLSASPLGLGDLKLHSTLNRPLDAEIDLISPGSTRADEISVRLASNEAFEGAGIDRPLLLNHLKFEVDTRADGTPYIKVVSDQPVTEPFLDFLVEVNWPNGKLVREYTTLLDPPVTVEEPPAAVAAPAIESQPAPATSRAATPATTQAPVTANDGARPERLKPSVGKAPDGAWTYGPVEKGATLRSIAQDLKAFDTAASVEQIMLALLKSNPEAFYDHNVNQLKAGYVLRIQDPAVLKELSQTAAMAEVRRQTAQWLGAKKAAMQAAGMARPAVPAGGEVAPSATEGPRLRLSAPEEAQKPASGGPEGAKGEASGDTAKIRNDLTAALEASAAARQENAELRDRLAKLEQRIADMQRLLKLKDESLAALQAQAGAAGKGAEGAFARLLGNPMLLAAAGVAVLLLATLGWLVVRRVRLARTPLEVFAGINEKPAPSVATTPESAVITEAAGGAAPSLERTSQLAMATGEGGGVDILEAGEDEIDILAEADVYLAYRRFDKAEELLKEALREEPARRDLVLKLLEVYSVGGNAEAFVNQAGLLKASLNPSETSIWDKVVAMGKRIAPGNALFEGAAASDEDAAAKTGGKEAESPSGQELFDVDFEKELSGLGVEDDRPVTDSGSSDPFAAAESTAPESEPAPAKQDLPDLDFTLDEDTLARLRQPGNELINEDQHPSPEEDRLVAVPETHPEAQQRHDDLGNVGDIQWLSAAGEDLLKFEDDDGTEEPESALISGEDEIGTKLDLAKAYLDMGDQESARNILSEVADEGDQEQQREAHELMRQMG